MKKFGTPTAAGPGVASDVVGFVVAGLPLGRVRARGVGVAVRVVVPASGWTGLHPRVELDVELMQPVAPVALPRTRRLRERLARGVAVAVAEAVAVGAAVGVAVAVLSGDCVAVGEFTTVSTGDGNGVGVLSSVTVAVLVASGAGESAAVAVGLDAGVAS